MFTNWISGSSKKDKDYKDVEKIINIISQIRSFKNELNVSPVHLLMYLFKISK